MVYTHTDTIAAIATAPGRGGIGIVRISGPRARKIGETITQTTLINRHAYYTPFFHPDKKHTIDQGICLLFIAPHSFTGEDIVELHGHGGPIVLDMLLNTVIRLGARIAKPGEFSERAYLNDKINLTQAEAIADLIEADSEQAARGALNSLQGIFSEKVDTLINEVTQLRIYVEAAIDFPEEDIDFFSDGYIETQLQTIEQQLQHTLQQTTQGVLINEGMKVVLAGKPNAGKSSLLNALSGNNTAIVTSIAGTTRDPLKETIHLDGMPLHIVDTAGLRDSTDPVEKIGIQRAWEEIQQADRLLLVVDPQQTDNIEQELHTFFSDNTNKNLDESRITIIINKIDQQHTPSHLDNSGHLTTLYLSAKTGDGMDLLTRHLQQVMGYQNHTEGNFIARRRHIDALERAQSLLSSAQQQLHHNAGELLAEELRHLQSTLGEITGNISADELLGKIFSNFCIGK